MADEGWSKEGEINEQIMQEVIRFREMWYKVLNKLKTICEEKYSDIILLYYIIKKIKLMSQKTHHKQATL